MPFQRVVATGYYDGPVEGFTECSECGQTYSFRKLDWDGLQDVRIFGFALLDESLETIAVRLVGESGTTTRVLCVPPLAERDETFVKELLAQPPTRVTAFEGWPGRSSLWRDTSGLDIGSISDWFYFLGLPIKRR